MEINNNKYNSLPEQVEENMKNISLLAQYLKEAYKTSLTLNTTDVSIAISDTNATTDTTNGWLITIDGKLFKITGGDGTTLLLEYYCTFPKGEDGSTLQIDDDNTSFTKVWSSIKTNSEIVKAKDKGIYYTNVEPTLVGGVLRANVSDILNISSDIPIKYKDLIVYTDGTNAKALYVVKELGTIVINMQVEKICDFAVGGGSQLYQHNITLFGVPSNTIKIQLLSEDNTSFNFTKLKNWLIDKGFETSGMDTKYYYKTSGHSSNNTTYEAIAYDNTNNTFRLWFGGSCITYNFNDSDFIDDTII